MTVIASPLQAFMVGEYDIVAHHSAAEARAWLIASGACGEADIAAEEVEPLPARMLDLELLDEAGNSSTLRGDLAKLTAPALLVRWN
ncbi:hypothetical protein QVM41_27935 [Pseudomonas shirazica]|uniref:hypothetical protein n=1 Tax=Pseudomonas shirazica TaxID=1940636 RepID=UPI0035256AE4